MGHWHKMHETKVTHVLFIYSKTAFYIQEQPDYSVKEIFE